MVQRHAGVRLGAAARARDAWSAISKLTEVVDGQRRIVPDPPLIVPLSDFPVEALGGDPVDIVRHAFLAAVEESGSASPRTGWSW